MLSVWQIVFISNSWDCVYPICVTRRPHLALKLDKFLSFSGVYCGIKIIPIFYGIKAIILFEMSLYCMNLVSKYT